MAAPPPPKPDISGDVYGVLYGIEDLEDYLDHPGDLVDFVAQELGVHPRVVVLCAA